MLVESKMHDICIKNKIVFKYSITYSPKSAGRLLNDISLSPNVVRLCNCENPDGNLKQ